MARVPYSFKALMEEDSFYPNGWSHRKFFPKRAQQQQDRNMRVTNMVIPTLNFLSYNSTGMDSVKYVKLLSVTSYQYKSIQRRINTKDIFLQLRI